MERGRKKQGKRGKGKGETLKNERRRERVEIGGRI